MLLQMLNPTSVAATAVDSEFVVPFSDLKTDLLVIYQFSGSSLLSFLLFYWYIFLLLHFHILLYANQVINESLTQLCLLAGKHQWDNYLLHFMHVWLRSQFNYSNLENVVSVTSSKSNNWDDVKCEFVSTQNFIGTHLGNDTPIIWALQIVYRKYKLMKKWAYEESIREVQRATFTSLHLQKIWCTQIYS